MTVFVTKAGQKIAGEPMSTALEWVGFPTGCVVLADRMDVDMLNARLTTAEARAMVLEAQNRDLQERLERLESLVVHMHERMSE